MLNVTLLGLTLLLGFAVTGSPPPPATECPLAVFSCQKSSAGNFKYECNATAQMPSPKYAPQYEWSVSAGQLIGNRKLPNVTIDLIGVKSETITVTLKVHWKNVPRICDRTLTDIIELRPKVVSNRRTGRTNPLDASGVSGLLIHNLSVAQSSAAASTLTLGALGFTRT